MWLNGARSGYVDMRRLSDSCSCFYEAHERWDDGSSSELMD